MAQQNIPHVSFNRGLISDISLARVDLAQAMMAASKMNNWIPKTQGPMIIRPGTEYIGSSLNDTGAAWIPFVAATDDTAIIELTHEKMRIWIDDSPLSRPAVDTTLTLSDTGWYNDSLGGGQTSGGQADAIPTMTSATTDGVTMSADSENTWDNANYMNRSAWKAGDDSQATYWADTGGGGSTLPSWLNINFGSGKTIDTYTLRAGNSSGLLDNAPSQWRLLGSQYDTGTFASDSGKWSKLDEVGDTGEAAATGWSTSEKRTYTIATPASYQHYRLYVTSVDGDTELFLSEIEMFEQTPGDTGQVYISGGSLYLNSGAREALARRRKRLAISDTGTEHSLDITVIRGPVKIRVGTNEGDDDLISETDLGTGYHNLAFTPESPYVHLTVQSNKPYDRIISSMTIGDSGTVEMTSPWSGSHVKSVRHDQSADVIYAAHENYRQRKIERRGIGRSWSIVEYQPDNGPLLFSKTSTAKFQLNQTYGNATMSSDIPFFNSNHVGSLFRLSHEGQGGKFLLGNEEAVTDVSTVVGISDTGTPSANNERRITFAVSGNYQGQITIERSFDDPTYGFKQMTDDYVTSGSSQDTGTFTTTVDDDDDNVTVWYRAKMTQWTAGTATVVVTYKSGVVTGVCRVVSYTDNQTVGIEVLENFSDTGKTDDWQEGAWSGVRGYPGSVTFHEGRLFWAGKANLWGSVSDDYENFDDEYDGDAAPISKTLATGPVDSIFYMISLLRLVIGTAGAEMGVKSSSLDEPLTPTNSSVKVFSTQGSKNIQAERMDDQLLFVQRSGQRVYTVGFGREVNTISDYESRELSVLVPSLLEAGVESISLQRQPDTRLHCVMSDGTVCILTYEPQEPKSVMAWSTWSTDTGTDSAVEDTFVIPGVVEDRVYYHIRRTINGQTKRYLEKWKLESECRGDTGLSWLADCAASSTDTGASLTRTGYVHLAGETVVGWGNDTGQSNSVGRDLTPDDTGGTQQLLSVDTGGDLILTDSGVKHVVAGLGYRADYKSAKLAYAAQRGTALTMLKRIDRMGFILHNTHNNGLFFGSDTGDLDPLPRYADKTDTGSVDADRIYNHFDQISVPFSGLWDEDSRFYLRAKAPRPATVLAGVPGIDTND